MKSIITAILLWAALVSQSLGEDGTTVAAEQVQPTPIAPPDPNAPAATADDIVSPAMTIEGTDSSVDFGELIDLQTKITPPKPKWLVDATYAWTILPTRDKVVVWPDNSRIVFGSGSTARTYTVIVTGSFVYAVTGADGKVASITQRQVTIIKNIQVGPAAPAPNNPDNPDSPGTPPATDPNVPANTSLSEAILEWTADLDMPSETKFTGLTVLARSFRAIAAQIDSGAIQTPQDIINKTRASNDRALADHKAWAPWFVNLNARLDAMSKAGALTTPKQFAETWRTIATALESFK